DFKRVGRAPKAVAVALACQIVLLPAICFGLVVLFDLPALLGIGMLLLAASPGGTTANLFSHLFRGDVALNITLTAINTVIAVVTLPLITGLAIAWYDRQDDVSMPLVEIVKVFALILLPVGIGMVVNARAPGFARRMDKPVRIGSAVILAVLVLGILLDQRENVGDYLADVGLIAALFCAISLVVGYYVPKALGVTGPQAIASSMEVGVHNATLAIFVAVEVLDEVEISVPAAVYSLIMFVFAALWGMWVSRQVGTREEASVA
ncbi:MAG TPA: bile acid:sodium symporter family protein, partial [Nocardioides sp.]|nr:bile acid:sodium symporter family protein [Nocardioides sp.]